MIEAARSEFREMGWADVASTADQTKVDLAVLFSEQQINPFRNLPFTVDCRSKGQLERSLFAAI